MQTEQKIKPVQEFPPTSGQKRKIITLPYILASFLGPKSFEDYVKLNPPSNPENKELTKDIEQALFHPYDDEMIFMNEGVFIILIENGYTFDNDLFALLVIGSIFDFIGIKGIDENPKLKACFEYYQNLEIKIKGEEELITQSQSFVHYMYDTKSNNQEPYQNALVNIPIIISSFRTNSGKILFPKFSYDII